MEAFFLIIHVVIAVALIGVVLVQRSDSDGLGLGGGGGGNVMSGRQVASFMTRATAILATLFILNSLWLGILAANKADISLVDRIEAIAPSDADATDEAGTAPDAGEPVVAPADEVEDVIDQSAAPAQPEEASEPVAEPVVPAIPQM